MIRVGLIGAGFIGRNHFNQYEKMADRATVVALCDKEADRRRGDWSKVGGNIGDKQGSTRDLGTIKPYVDWQELLADPDVDMVDICAPTFSHTEISLAALSAGKHVMCEKPMALTVEQCDEMIAAAKESPGKFMIAQCVRFWPEYAYLKQIMDEERFGELRALHLRRQAASPDYSLDNWIVNPELSGGAILDLHVHDVDYVLYVQGKPQAVTAQGHCRVGGSVDRVHALWHYKTGMVVELEGAWDLHGGWPFNMGFTAVFDKATIYWDLVTGKPLTIYRDGCDPETPEMATEDGYFAEIDYFLGCIERNEAPKLSTPEASRDAVAIALAEKESVLTGETVRIM